MKISELILKLQAVQSEHGDLECIYLKENFFDNSVNVEKYSRMFIRWLCQQTR